MYKCIYVYLYMYIYKLYKIGLFCRKDQETQGSASTHRYHSINGQTILKLLPTNKYGCIVEMT